MKKIISIFTFVVICFSMELTPVCAYENDIDKSNVVSEECIALITRNIIEGTSEEWVYTPSEIQTYSELIIPPTYPTDVVYEGNIDIMPMSTRSDNRVRLTGSSINSGVGYLYCGFDFNGDGIDDAWTEATASVQLHDIIISCAHAVWRAEYSNYNDGWAQNIRFYAGEDSKGIYIEYARGIKPTVSQAYVDNTSVECNSKGEIVSYTYDFQNDWSIIQVDKDMTRTCLGLGLHGCGDPELGINISLIGYPHDKGKHEQWKSDGKILSFDDNIMRYNVYNTDGFSGGPLIDSGCLVYGINTHIYEHPNDVGGTRMYPWLFGLILQCREESRERWE